MIDKKTVLAALEAQGKAEAKDLRSRALGMSGTAVIAEEQKAPTWDSKKDYSSWPSGGPVIHDGQTYKLIQPHNAAAYSGTPATLPALWSVCHTTDPKKAKAWMAPMGISGMYMTGECYKAEDGSVYRCKQDNVVHDAAALPTAWEVEDV